MIFQKLVICSVDLPGSSFRFSHLSELNLLDEGNDDMLVVPNISRHANVSIGRAV